jgi:peptide deformylase
MQVVYYPDPVLKLRSAEVDPRSEEIRALVRAMIESMHESQGVGLAAPQVGRSLRIFVASETGEIEDAIAFLNPRVEPFGPTSSFEEGCLSFPDIRAPIVRPERVRVVYQDLEGNERRAEFDELMARIVQHEYDHLEGVLFIERMTPADRLRIRPDLKTLEEQFRPR